MKRINEDIQPYSSFAGMTFDDVYDEYGEDMFQDENIPYLKEAGIIGENGYPVRPVEGWDGQMQDRQMDLNDLCDYEYNFIKSRYIRDLIRKEIRTHFNLPEDGTGEVSIEYTDASLPSDGYGRSMPSSFLEKCFHGDVYDDFWGNYTENSISDCSSYIDDIPDNVLDYLEEKGFPRDIFEQIYKGTADEDSPLAKYYDDLEVAFCQAVGDAYAMGSADACLDDFQSAWDESIPEGCTCEYIDEDKRVIKVSQSFIDEHLEEIWAELQGYSDYIVDCFINFVINTINENLDDNFTEPYYGWSDFSQDSFEDGIWELVSEIDIEEPKQEEENLLKFNGDTGEYDEDLDEDIEPTAYKYPEIKKLFYKYKDYNPELSAKAYQLDTERVLMLLDWAEQNDQELYREVKAAFDSDYDEVGEYLGCVCMSSIKPSFADSYDGMGWSIWEISTIAYETRFLGAIPKKVGTAILSGRNLKEDIEVKEFDVVALPAGFDMNELVYTDAAAREAALDVIQYKAKSPNFVARAHIPAPEEGVGHVKIVATDRCDFAEAWELYNRPDAVYSWMWYLPDDDDVEAYSDFFGGFDVDVMILCRDNTKDEVQDTSEEYEEIQLGGK